MKTYHDLPTPNSFALARSHALAAIIATEIDQWQGMMPFARFMELALYHPDFGYYQNPDFKFGKEGDFTTASEISPLYAHCFARQSIALFESLGHDSILELGAGSGRFALNFLDYLQNHANVPGHYYIYEPSDSLRKQQQKLLGNRVTWLDELPKSFNGIIIANEVLDALPVHLFTITNNQIKERMVGKENNIFTWQTAEPSKALLLDEIKQLQKTYQLPDGYQSEINLAACHYTGTLCEMLKQGVILLADYGYGQKEYYHPARTQGTLSCFYQHITHQQPLQLPGLQDITSHVDFTRIISTACDYDCNLLGYTTQSAFLLANDLLEEAEKMEANMNASDAVRLHQAIKLLTMPMEMGDRVKIMAIGRECNIKLPVFTQHDRRRDL